MRIIISILITLLLYSCVPYKAILDDCLDKPPSVTIRHWGYPDIIRQEPDGGFTYIYEFDGTFNQKRFFFNKDSICYLLRTR